MKNIFKLLLALVLTLSISIADGQITAVNNNVDLTKYASAIGKDNESTGYYSTAIGRNNQALGDGSFSFGFTNYTIGEYSVAIGSYLKTTQSNSIIIGSGLQNTPMENNIANSVMIGGFSNLPTLIVFGSSSGIGTTGKIGIGNVTSPLAKLHLRADEGEEASFFIEPNSWSGGDFANLFLGNFYHGITADTNQGLHFLSQKNYLFGAGNVGLGVEEPKAKLHVDGDILFENPTDGFIMKSENGLCWKVTINNDGSFASTSVDCNSLTGTQPNEKSEFIPLYIYPNPASGYLVIENPENSRGLVAKFRSINGVLLMTSKLQAGENQFDLNFATEGMLIVSVYDQMGNLITSEKIIVN